MITYNIRTNSIGSDRLFNVLNGHKPILSCFINEANLFPLFYTAQTQLSNFQKLRIGHTKGKNFSVAVLLSLSLSQKNLLPNQLKHKNLPPQVHFATLTPDNQNNPVQSLVKQDTVIPSQKDDCQPILADFGNDLFSFRIEDTGNNITIKPLD